METELTLLKAAKDMKEDALVAIFDLYSSSLYNYALRLCRDPFAADNIVGDVFVKFLDKLAAGKGPDTNLRSYLYQMTYHLIIDEVRFNHHQVSLEDLELSQGNGSTSLVVLENRILFDALVMAIKNNLTEDQRHVIILRFLEGFSLHETAKIIGKPVYNVKVIQNRGIAKLRKVLGDKVR
jgi:RNA polymerase sigma-70 factor (ECF subfamily)